MVLLDDHDEERFIPFPRQTAPIPAVEASGYRSLKKRQPLPDDYYGYTHPAHPARNHSPAVAAAAAPSCVRHAPRALAAKRSGKYDPYANYIQPPPPKDQVLARREKRAADRERTRQEVAAAQRRPRSVTPTLTARARSTRSVSPSPSTHKRGPAAAWSYSQKPPDHVFSRPAAGSSQVRSSSVTSKRKGDGHPDAAQRSKTPPVIHRRQPKAWRYLPTHALRAPVARRSTEFASSIPHTHTLPLTQLFEQGTGHLRVRSCLEGRGPSDLRKEPAQQWWKGAQQFGRSLEVCRHCQPTHRSPPTTCTTHTTHTATPTRHAGFSTTKQAAHKQGDVLFCRCVRVRPDSPKHHTEGISNLDLFLASHRGSSLSLLPFLPPPPVMPAASASLLPSRPERASGFSLASPLHPLS